MARPLSRDDDSGTPASGIFGFASAPGDSYDQVSVQNAVKTLPAPLAAAAATLRGRRGSQHSRCTSALFTLLLAPQGLQLCREERGGPGCSPTAASCRSFTFPRWPAPPNPQLSPGARGHWSPSSGLLETKIQQPREENSALGRFVQLFL